MRKKKNAGFTLTEIVVVIAVSGIFFSFVALILANSFNIFGSSKDDYNLFSDIQIIEKYTDLFFNKLNVQGKKLIVSSSQVILADGDNQNQLILYDESIIYRKKQSDSTYQETIHQFKNIQLTIDNPSSKVIVIKMNQNEEIIKENAYHILGGIEWQN